MAIWGHCLLLLLSSRPGSQLEKRLSWRTSLPDLKKVSRVLKYMERKKNIVYVKSAEKECYSVMVPDGDLFIYLFVCFAEIKMGHAHFPNEAIHLLQLPSVKIKVFFISLNRRCCQHFWKEVFVVGE